MEGPLQSQISLQTEARSSPALVHLHLAMLSGVGVGTCRKEFLLKAKLFSRRERFLLKPTCLRPKLWILDGRCGEARKRSFGQKNPVAL